MAKHVCVIGGGVIGLSTAYALVREGFSVTLLEAGEAIARSTSFANGGQLSYRHVSPLADAGVPLKGLQWMLSGDAPLRLRLRLDPRQWRWLWQFLAACRRSVNQANSAHLLRLSLLSRQTLGQWQTEDDLADFSWRDNGKLVVYRSAAGFGGAARQLLDPQQQVLTPAECRQLEPALEHVADKLAGGIFTPGDAVADCYQFCLRLQEKLQQSGRCTLVTGQAVTHFRRQGNTLQAACSASAEHPADAFVLATSWASRPLLAPLGIDPLIYPLKGYSLTLPLSGTHTAPDISVTDFERKTVYARLGERLRIAAMVDIVGYDQTLPTARLASLRRIAGETFPHAGDFDRAEPWAGLRPATPTGLPVLGGTPLGNLWLNLGHGALGFTLAAGSARLLSDLIAGRQDSIDTHAFALSPAR
jgi:D-amino-acid dehydrogenase